MSEFSFRELECFLAVAEELSFTRAAERLHLAQPPLSRHVRNLEERLGVSLFARTKRKVSLTTAGEAFREEVGGLMARARRAGDAARRAAEGETDRLEIGFVSAVLSPELVRVFTEFRRASPEVRLNLHDRLPAEQISRIATGELHLGFIGVAPDRLPAGIEVRRWREEALLVFLPPDHECSGERAVRLRDLAEEAFVSISAEAAPAYAAHLRALCAEAGFRPRVVQEARRAQAVAAMTAAGTGIAILPESLDRITGNGVPLVRGGGRPETIEHVVAHRERPGETTATILDGLAAY